MTKMSNGRTVSKQTVRTTPEYEARQKWLKSGQEGAARQGANARDAEDDLDTVETADATETTDAMDAVDTVDELNEGDETDEEEKVAGDGDTTNRAEPDTARRMEDACMAFLEKTEGRLTYHQAQLVRLACEGFDSDDTLDRALYILNRAKLVSDGRTTAIPIDDPLNNEVMDFLERHGWSLEYHEWEVIRRICRGCDAETLAETAFVLERARNRRENA